MRKGDSIIMDNQLFLLFPEMWTVLWPCPWEIDASIFLSLAFSSQTRTEETQHYIQSSTPYHLNCAQCSGALRRRTTHGSGGAGSERRGEGVLQAPQSWAHRLKESVLTSLVCPLLPSAVAVASIKCRAQTPSYPQDNYKVVRLKVTT